MKAYERAELIGAVAQTTEMLSQLLKLLDEFLDSAEFGRVPTASEIARMREHAQKWRGRLRRCASGSEPRRSSRRVCSERRRSRCTDFRILHERLI